MLWKRNHRTSFLLVGLPVPGSGPCSVQEQTAALLEAARHESIKHRLIVTLAVVTGLRRGEIMGLEWKDINFENNTLEVRQVSQYIPGKGQFTKEPKNETSQRIISVPESVILLIQKYKTYQATERLKAGDLWKESDMLFTTWEGQPMHIDTISSWFQKFLKKMNYRHYLSMD